ncbi:MAG: RHS repeat domain-containing protein [Verrucomicrobiota bacterium]
MAERVQLHLRDELAAELGGLIAHKHYILGPAGRIAIHTDRSDFTKDTRWFHTDGLGSITVVSDEQGRVLKRHTYDAWGKQSTAYTNTNTDPGITNTSPSTRGFTDHEMLGDFGLIHMNGRVYDPVLGRFLSADPYVGDPTDSQDYNRYSYVGNNPLGSTDPTGFLKLKEILPAVIAVVVTAVVIVCTAGTGAPATAGLWGQLGYGLAHATAAQMAIAGAAGGFASGFSGSLLNGGSIGDAFKSGVIGAAVGAATAWAAHGIGNYFDEAMQGSGFFSEEAANWGGRTLAHGVVGGLASEAQGGEFRHGFYASAASAGFMHSSIGQSMMENASIGVRIATAAAIGGTASVLGGGKFANGAVTSAFQQMFNAEAHRDWLDRSADFAAGFGDTVTFGLSRFLRDKVFSDFYKGTVDYDSTSYTVGEVTGVATTTVVGGVAGLRSAGSMAGKAGAEFSHWIPARMGGARSLFNGNFVSKATHALSDPYRYRFMPRVWKLANPMPNVLTQQLVRLPMVYTYGAAGAAVGGASMAANGAH